MVKDKKKRARSDPSPLENEILVIPFEWTRV